MCEQLAQGCYLAVERPGVEPATSRSRVRHATARLGSQSKNDSETRTSLSDVHGGRSIVGRQCAAVWMRATPTVDLCASHVHLHTSRYNLPGNLPGAAAPVPQDPQKHVRP